MEVLIKYKPYVTGVFRGDNGNNMVTHLYQGTFHEPGYPMCSRGWQRKWYDENGKLEDWEYSIFRNIESKKGICKVCFRRALEERAPFETPIKLKQL